MAPVAQTWVPGDDANFYSDSGPTSTITIWDPVNPVTVGNITFTGMGYTVSRRHVEPHRRHQHHHHDSRRRDRLADHRRAALVKEGDGTLTLTSTQNNYNGGTIVNNGILSLGPGFNGSAVGSVVGAGPVTVNSGGTLVGVNCSMGFGYSGWNNYQASDLIVNGGVVTSNEASTGQGGFGVGNLAMAGGTINGDVFMINGSGTISGATTAIISASQLFLDGVGRSRRRAPRPVYRRHRRNVGGQQSCQ